MGERLGHPAEPAAEIQNVALRRQQGLIRKPFSQLARGQPQRLGVTERPGRHACFRECRDRAVEPGAKRAYGVWAGCSVIDGTGHNSQPIQFVGSLLQQGF